MVQRWRLPLPPLNASSSRSPDDLWYHELYITPTPSFSYVCVALCRSWERTNPIVPDQLSTTQPRTPFVLWTQIVKYPAVRLFFMPWCTIGALSSYRTLPAWPALQCMEIFGIWNQGDRHRNQLTILVMCAMLPRNGFIWNNFTNNVACVFNKTPPGTFALSDASTSSCQGSRHHQPSSHRQRLAIASKPSSELSDYIYEPHLAFQPRPTPTLL